MKPWTPRNGADLTPGTICGNAEIAYLTPDFLMSLTNHGPVT